MCSTRAERPAKPLAARDAAASLAQYSQLQCDSDGALYWLAYLPAENGRNIICRRRTQGRIEHLTPDDFSARSRVHEYGGASWRLLDNQLVFVNNEDQQLWLQSLAEGSSPVQLSHFPDYRYGAPTWDHSRNRLLAVEEDHSGTVVINRLVAISLHNGQRTALHEGFDFYGKPALNSDGTQLSWVSWDHPHQPWTETRLYLAELDPRGYLQPPTVVAGHEQPQSITQPHFNPQQQLIATSDRDAWWKPWQFDRSDSQLSSGWFPASIGADSAEYSPAPWQLGNCNIVWHRDGSWIGASHRQGNGALVWHRNGRMQKLATNYQHFSDLALHQDRLYAVAASATSLSQLIEIDLVTGTVTPLLPEQTLACSITEPQPMLFPVGGRKCCHGFFYSPATGDMDGQTPPPLIVTLHGGPTSISYPVLKPALQYWTSRGFAVLELNYRGSTGFGRHYRMQLQKNWGISDIEDADAAIDELSQQGLINPAQVFIRGGSAGGYTALAALVDNPRYTAAACHYGISDLNLLAAHTHKFESRYLDWLIGDPIQHQTIYQVRSPLNNIDRINTPVIFFQGLQDKVVPPDQTARMARSLQQRGIAAEYHSFANEGHGFRQPAHQHQVLELEYQFYRQYL